MSGSHRPRDLKLEALARVLRREIPWRQHCHRADDIATALRLADEFGYDLVIDHGTEAYLIADKIAAAGVPVVTGPLITARSKVELRNRTMANPGLLAAAGVTIAIATDHPVVPVHLLIVQAALAVREGLDRETALRAVTINPARIMRRRRPDRLAYRRQGRGRRDLVGRPAGRDVPRRGLRTSAAVRSTATTTGRVQACMWLRERGARWLGGVRRVQSAPRGGPEQRGVTPPAPPLPSWAVYDAASRHWRPLRPPSHNAFGAPAWRN